PTARAQTIPDDASSVTTESTDFSEQARTGFAASVDLQAVYARTLPSDKDLVKPPHSPMMRTASGLAWRDGSAPNPRVRAALLLAFNGPMPLTMRTTSFDPQCTGERTFPSPAIFRMGSPSIGEAAKT